MIELEAALAVYIEVFAVRELVVLADKNLHGAR
jgi:hypothetical protein